MSNTQSPERFCLHRLPREAGSTPIAKVLSTSPSTCPACAREEIRLRIANIEARYDQVILESAQKERDFSRNYVDLYADVESGAHSERLKEVVANLGKLDADKKLQQRRKTEAVKAEKEGWEAQWDLKWDPASEREN